MEYGELYIVPDESKILGNVFKKFLIIILWEFKNFQISISWAITLKKENIKKLHVF